MEAMDNLFTPQSLTIKQIFGNADSFYKIPRYQRPYNLTLLCGAKNIEASNNPFKDKIKVYQGKGLYDDKDSKITAFNITQRIVNDYNSNTYNKEWNEKSIKDRWNWFCGEVEKIIDISLSEIKIRE